MQQSQPELYRDIYEEIFTFSRKITTKDTLIYYNRLWVQEAYLENLDSKTFDVIRSNGQIESDWNIYNPNKHDIEKILPLELDVFGRLTVVMIKVTETNQIITKNIELKELKKQAFEKKYSEFGQYFFLNYFPNFIYHENEC